MGIPGDHVNRVETYHHPLELAVARELQSRVRLPTDEGTVQSQRSRGRVRVGCRPRRRVRFGRVVRRGCVYGAPVRGGSWRATVGERARFTNEGEVGGVCDTVGVYAADHFVAMKAG